MENLHGMGKSIDDIPGFPVLDTEDLDSLHPPVNKKRELEIYKAMRASMNPDQKKIMREIIRVRAFHI